jgi:hypothetical protein
MRTRALLLGGLTALALWSAPAPGEPPPGLKPSPKARAPALTPLHFLPAEVDLLVEVPNPRRAVQTLAGLDLLKALSEFPPVQELYNSTQSRRFRQLVAYFEKELGAKWPDLLDRVAGNGLALGVKLGPNPAPALLVVRGKDESAVEKFVALGLKVLEDELARQESALKVEKGKYLGADTFRAGKDFHAARVGATLLLSNRESALHAGLDAALKEGKKSLADLPAVAESAKLLPRGPLARAWLRTAPIHKAPQAKALYKSPRDDTNLTVLLGEYLDVLGRSPYVAAGVYQEKDGFLTTVRMPRGREGMGADRALHLPPEGKPATLPLLEPKGVLYSDSYYLDLAKIWEDRAKLFPKKQVEALERVDRQSAFFLAGARLNQLLTQAGARHRTVVVHQGDRRHSGYKAEPKQYVPAFAFVFELRQPEKFGKSMESVLRAVGLFLSTQVKLKLFEEKHAGCVITGYRFDEKTPLKADVNGVRFNFSPCFARVGDQFVLSSTAGLCRELVDLLLAEQKSAPKLSHANFRAKLYSTGGADALKSFEDQLITQVILDQAVPPGEAKAQVEKLIALVRKFGTLGIESRFDAREFRYEFRTRGAK